MQFRSTDPLFAGPTEAPRRERMDLASFATHRQTMVDCQIRTFEVIDQRLINRFLEVPREQFLPDGLRTLAYSDVALRVPSDAAGEESRTLLTPMVLARLIQGGRPKVTDRVLDVAGGNGYSAAILAGLAAEVIALETGPVRRRTMQACLATCGLDRVRTLDGDLAQGASSDGPFDVILVNGAAAANLEGLMAQLAAGGRLLVIRRAPDDPTGRAAKAVCYEKRGSEIGNRYLFDASAPLLNAFAPPPSFVF